MTTIFRLGTLVASAACVAITFVACGNRSGAGPAESGNDSGSVGDGNAVSDAPLACPPAALDEGVPGVYRHAQTVQPAACTVLLLNDYYSSCLAPNSSVSDCDQSWGAGEDAQHATCQTCIVTSSSATMWGPLVDYSEGGDGGAGGIVSVNVAGCIELLDPSQIACAESVQQADECEHAACDAVCPVSDATSFANWNACVDASANGECVTYAKSATCASTEDAGPAAACVTGSDFQDQFMAIAAVFCGGGALQD